MSAALAGIGLGLDGIKLGHDALQLRRGQAGGAGGPVVHDSTVTTDPLLASVPLTHRLPTSNSSPARQHRAVPDTVGTGCSTLRDNPGKQAKEQAYVSVKTVTRSELELRRAQILAALGQTLAEFRELSEARTLTSDEWDARTELDEIGFLLGEASQ